MGYEIRLDVFEGPLELLLHLIEREEIDIYHVPIARLTGQYLEYLEQMQKLDLEVASEFLVMAATLIELKSRALLPSSEGAEPEERSAQREQQEELQRDLVGRLLEYRKFRVGAASLASLRARRLKLYSRVARQNATGARRRIELVGGSLDDLVAAHRAAMVRAARKEAVEEITAEQVTVAEKIAQISQALVEQVDGVRFGSLVSGAGGRLEMVVTLLALLEMVRLGWAKAVQTRLFGDIIVKPGPAVQAAGGDWR